MKICSKCKEVLPLSSFYTNPTHKDGHSSACKKCNCASRDHAKQRAYLHTWQGKEAYLERKREKQKLHRSTDDGREQEKLRRQRYSASAEGKINNLRKRMKRRYPDNVVSIEPRHWNHILGVFGNRCAYCRDGGLMTIDHFVPLSKGGKTEPGNIAPSCMSCNCSKQNKEPGAWLTKTVYLIVRIALAKAAKQ